MREGEIPVFYGERTNEGEAIASFRLLSTPSTVWWRIWSC